MQTDRRQHGALSLGSLDARYPWRSCIESPNMIREVKEGALGEMINREALTADGGSDGGPEELGAGSMPRLEGRRDGLPDEAWGVLWE